MMHFHLCRSSDNGEKLSGFGFELTFRLKRDDDEPEGTNPPIWPATVMQALARYVYQTKNTLCSGDHVSWHCSLDESESKIGHMLMTDDPQLKLINTAYGKVKFIQIVGVCDEELKAAQQWEGNSIISIMSRKIETGGPYLITDMRRVETIYDQDTTQEEIEEGISLNGSNLSGVSAKCKWSEKEPKWLVKKKTLSSDSESDTANERADLIAKGQSSNNPRSCYEYRANSGRKSASRNASRNDSRTESRMSVSHDQNPRNQSRMSFESETGALESGELLNTVYLNSVHLNFNMESGQLLPLVLEGRLKHHRHFTFKSINGDIAITFVTDLIQGTHASLNSPFAKHGPWLQIFVPEEVRQEMLEDLKELAEQTSKVDLPKTYGPWHISSGREMTITIVTD